jgi:hypothetical protein
MTFSTRCKLDMRQTIACTGLMAAMMAVCLCGGCGYSSDSLYPDKVTTVCVEMFDNKTFWRGQEYDLTNAICKRIEAQTPYRILSEKADADTIMTGYIASLDKGTLVMEPEVGRPLEQEMVVTAVVTWKNRRTGEVLLDKVSISASADFSQFQGQGDAYTSKLAVNRLAENIVSKMRKKW